MSIWEVEWKQEVDGSREVWSVYTENNQGTYRNKELFLCSFIIVYENKKKNQKVSITWYETGNETKKIEL